MKPIFAVCMIMSLLSCNTKKETAKETTVPVTALRADTSTAPVAAIADAATILSRKQVPILCYHHIRDTKPGDYVVPPSLFASQLQALADSGYQTILPDQLYNYLATGAAIPEKSFM